jgi:hypothetical protein
MMALLEGPRPIAGLNGGDRMKRFLFAEPEVVS